MYLSIGNFVEVLESYANIGPILDMCIVQVSIYVSLSMRASIDLSIYVSRMISKSNPML
jgi:hypothetical protein